jgi:glycosyltransferase involved in cell wall biosynthesis
MKILYFIFVSAGGRGGHFHSLNQISMALGTTDCSIHIISMGGETSEVINRNPFFKKHLYFTRRNYIKFYKQLYIEIKNSQVDILHFFDAHSFSIYYPLSLLLNKKIVLNKCGGPNPTSYPAVSNIILFTEENRRWFLSKKHFANKHIKVIPNRVSSIHIYYNKNYRKDEGLFNIVRICRIGTTYYNSILNGINLIKELNQKGVNNVKFYIIGKVTEELDFFKLKEQAEGYNVEFITEDEITHEASRMLYLADAVIGTGRGAMEALSLGIPVLVPSKQTNFPILFHETNWHSFIDKNFTERSQLKNINAIEEVNKINKLIHCKSFYDSSSKFSKDIFDKYFDINVVKKEYVEFYNSAVNCKLTLENFTINFKRTLSTTYRMFNNNF